MNIVDKGNGDNTLDPGETWVYSASTVASSPGQQLNVGTVTANSVQAPSGEDLTASDPAYHFVETLKFFVVDKGDKATYSYTESGDAVDSSALAEGNSDPRGISADEAGERTWVIDKDKFVYVYDTAGTLVGSWQANGIGGEAEGIAVHPDSGNAGLWIVDRNTKAVFFYAAGKTRTTGALNPTYSFSLNLNDKIDTKNDHPKGITTDGNSLWVVDDDGGTDKVFKYTADNHGTLLGSWEIADVALEEPRGITVDPDGGSTIWIVDKKTDMVYQFDNATGVTSGSESADALFALAAENADAEGIADPPPAWALTSLAATSSNASQPVVVGAQPVVVKPNPVVGQRSADVVLTQWSVSDASRFGNATTGLVRSMTARTPRPAAVVNGERILNVAEAGSGIDRTESVFDAVFEELGGRKVGNRKWGRELRSVIN
jgi:hypothetical protein